MAAASLLAAAKQTAADRPRAMVEKRAIPASGELLPVLGLGTYQSFDAGTDTTQYPALSEVLKNFLAHGATLIDSSPMYGSSESVIGELSTQLGITEKLFMATKVWTSGRAAGIRQMEESFARMGVKRMDLMQIHNLLDWRTHLDTLKEWKAAGRIRYLGITHYHSGAYDELERLMKLKAFDFVQFNYSIAEREAEQRILPLARDLGVAVIVNRPFAQASLFSRVKGRDLPDWTADFDCRSWAQFFLKYILGHPAVTCAIPATGKVKHLVDNMAAGTGRLPDSTTRTRMAKFMDAL
jgi:diketogulonate reductase-like aldo/keto reductase